MTGSFDRLLMHSSNFNSHAHVERDHWACANSSEKKNFNSHAHVERDAGSFRGHNAHKYFNSHAHVERDIEKIIIDWLGAISTHTLTWSVTICSVIW